MFNPLVCFPDVKNSETIAADIIDRQKRRIFFGYRHG